MWNLLQNLKDNFLRLIEICEKYFMRILISCILLLIFFQSFLCYDYLTYGWNIINDDGSNNFSDKSVSTSSLQDEYIVLKLLSYYALHKAEIIVNGEVLTNFNSNFLKLHVHPGDEITIDCTYYNSPIKIEVITSEGVSLTRTKEVITCLGEKYYLGKVLKNNN